MAGFTRTSGDLKQVLNLDTDSYTVGSINDYTTAVTVQPQGPKLVFCTVTYTGTSTTGAQVKATLDAIQAKTTVHLYEFTTVGGGNDALAVAFYDNQAWGSDVTATGAGTLDAEITAAAGEAVAITATATFTN